MAVLIVGGDRISNIRDYLNEHGYQNVNHWAARRNSDCHKIIPKNTKLIVVLTDFLNHGMAKRLRRDATQLGLPMVFSKNSVSDLSYAFERFGNLIH